MGNIQTSKKQKVDGPLTTAAPDSCAQQEGVSLTISTEYSQYSSKSSSNTLVGVNLVAPPAPSSTERAPVDCVVVSDVSGSMGGPKMDLLRETGKLLLNEFVEKDRVGLVTFDSDVKERFPLQAISKSARSKATSIVDSFHAGTATNLSEGLFTGIRQLINDKKANRSHVRTVLLMTDGQANHGLRSSAQIVPILTEMLKDTGITVHTFGYGAGHDSAMLREISTAGNGSYYFVEGVDDIRSAFGDCLGGMLSVVAQNLQVELEAINGTSITKVHHKNAVVVEANKKYRIPFADLYGEEQRDVLLNMTLSPTIQVEEDHTKPSAQILQASLQYIDVIAARPATSSTSIGVCRVLEVNKTELVKNSQLDLQSIRLKVADTIEEARKTAEKGDLKAARTAIEATRVEVKNTASRCAHVEGAKETCEAFELDLKDCSDGLVDRNAFRSMKMKMTYLAEGHQQQRCMESTMVMDEVGSSSLRSNAYRTKSKKGVASKFAGIF